MDLIYYIYAVGTDLRWDSYLLGQCPYIIHRIVGCRIQFMYAVGTIFIKGLARFTLVTSLSMLRYIETINGLGEYPRTSGLTYPPRSAEQICMSQMVIYYGVLQGSGDGWLTNNIIESGGSVFSGRYNKLLHMSCKDSKQVRKYSVLGAKNLLPSG